MNLHHTAKLNHLSFPTTNVAETAAFFEKYLGCEIAYASDSYLLKRDGFDIVLDHVVEQPAWPKNFHFGLELASLDDLHAMYREFVAAGVPMETEVFNNTRGSRFFCRTPGGVLVEINTRADIDQDKWKQLFG